jgi:hypothetical protein
MKFNRSLSFFLFVSAHSIFAFDFIDPSLKNFVQRIGASEFYNDFYDYHSAFLKRIDKLGKHNSTKKEQELTKVRNIALWSLENNHPNWALQIKMNQDSIAKDNDLKKLIDEFLIRYGVYQEFLKNSARRHASTWYRVKSYSHHISSKIASFFGKSRKKTII